MLYARLVIKFGWLTLVGAGGSLQRLAPPSNHIGQAVASPSLAIRDGKTNSRRPSMASITSWLVAGPRANVIRSFDDPMRLCPRAFIVSRQSPGRRCGSSCPVKSLSGSKAPSASIRFIKALLVSNHAPDDITWNGSLLRADSRWRSGTVPRKIKPVIDQINPGRNRQRAAADGCALKSVQVAAEAAPVTGGV